MKNGLVRNWMSSPVVTITPETRLGDARKIMNAENIRALPVVKNGKLEGIITRRGLLRTDLSILGEGAWQKLVDIKDVLVGSVMTVNPLTILTNSPLPKAARVMMENKITALPVLDDQKKLVGIITSSDIFRAIIAELPDLKDRILVQDYMSREIVSIDPETSLLEAHRLMGVERIRFLPVLENGKMVGLVTRTDLMSVDPSRFLSKNQQEQSLQILTSPVEKIMVRSIITVPAQSPIVEAARLMFENKIHGLPVVDGEGNLEGVITETDLFRLVVQKFF